jgi:hypothetical protein
VSHDPGRPGQVQAGRDGHGRRPGHDTSARIRALNTAQDGTELEGAQAYGWITALRAPVIRKLMAENGPLQMSLSGQQDLAEITSQDFPGERLIACRNPVLAAERACKREALLAGFYMLRTPVLASQLDAPAVVTATRTSSTSSGTSAISKPTTWTCGPSTTARKNGSKPRS